MCSASVWLIISSKPDQANFNGYLRQNSPAVKTLRIIFVYPGKTYRPMIINP